VAIWDSMMGKSDRSFLQLKSHSGIKV